LTQLSAPILNGGNLASQAKQTEFETAQAYQAYRDTLLSAVNEVEQALDQEQSLTTQLEHTQRALNNQLNNVAQYEQRYRQGLVDILDVLSTQQTTFDLRAQLNDLTYQRLANRINLGLALGLGVAN
jgi:outer membrane protein TolC